MTRARVGAALVAVLVLSGCSLHYPGGVRLARSVPGGRQVSGAIQVQPPGPQQGAPPDQVVSGFLDAESDPDRSHAIARSFLVPERRSGWDDAAGVLVYDLNTRTLVQDDQDPGKIVMTADLLGRIDRSGAYTAYDPGQTVRETYHLRLVGTTWGIEALPQGLRLSPGQRDRSYRWQSVYFLSHSYGETSDHPHLVADPVFLPVALDPAQFLVSRLLAGWSSGLGGGAVETAVPPGTSLRSPVTTAGGTVTVDLAMGNCQLSTSVGQHLSAQLVWTLRELGPSFLRLALLCRGRPLAVEGASSVQDRGTWADYDPDALGGRAQGYYIDQRSVRALDGAVTGGPASDGRQPVDAAAVSPGSSLALLTVEGGSTVLRTGPLLGPTYAIRLRQPGLSSPSWGSGEQGVWLLENGPVSTVLLAPNRPDVAPRPVHVEGVPGLGKLRSLRVSRDGARIALVAGPDDDPRLYLGRIEPRGPGGVEVAGLRVVVGLHDVHGVAWDTGRSLVALGRVGAIGPLPVRVAVDGSSVVRIVRQGLEQVQPTSVTAAPALPVIVGALAGGQDRLFRDNGAVFAALGPGRAPFYPG